MVIDFIPVEYRGYTIMTNWNASYDRCDFSVMKYDPIYGRSMEYFKAKTIEEAKEMIDEYDPPYEYLVEGDDDDE